MECKQGGWFASAETEGVIWAEVDMWLLAHWRGGVTDLTDLTGVTDLYFLKFYICSQLKISLYRAPPLAGQLQSNTNARNKSTYPSP